MTKTKLEYIVSAPSRLGIFHESLDNPENVEHVKRGLKEIYDISIKRVSDKTSKFDHAISLLFNAYTEQNFIGLFERYGNMGFPKIYGDSGGLQMVTRNLTITDALKDKVYETQAHVDAGMCFDVICLDNMTGIFTKTERMKINNKLFRSADHENAGTLTGQNIKRQIEVFRKNKSDAKVFLIVQGNSPEDMLRFYSKIMDVLGESDYGTIGGIAVADTCMGNGTLQSVKMIEAAQRIGEICPESFKQQLHFLGVGSVSRMRPALNLIESGYLNAYKAYSYDSSTHTSTFDNGVWRVNEKIYKLGVYRNKESEEAFSTIYDAYESFNLKYLTKDQFMRLIFCPDQLDWNFSRMKKRMSEGTLAQQVVGILIKTQYILYQVSDMMISLDSATSPQYDMSPIGLLTRITSHNDLSLWYDKYASQVDSNAIKNDKNFSSLASLI